MTKTFIDHLSDELADLHESGLYKTERVIISKQAGTVALATDQRARVSPVLAPFFGRAANSEQSPVLLARRTRVPIIVLHCLWRADAAGFVFRAQRVFRPEELAEVSIEEATAQINAEFERAIRAAPDQYLWIHDRFRDAPADEDASVPAA